MSVTSDDSSCMHCFIGRQCCRMALSTLTCAGSPACCLMLIWLLVDIQRREWLVQAVTSINGVLLNKISLEHKGTYTVTGNQSGYAAKMKLHASGMLTSKSKLHEASSLLLDCLRREAEPMLTFIDVKHVKQQA